MLRIAWFLLLPLLADDVPVTEESFSAKQLGNNIELMTPYGPKLLWGDTGFDGQTNYRLEIPIEDLKSKEQKELERKQREAEAEAAAAAERGPNNQVETKIIEKEREIIKEVDRESSKETEKLTEKERKALEEAQAASTPKKMIVEYDETDRFVLEANRLFNRGKFYEASMVVEELLRRKPDFVRGWVMKGSLMHVQGHKDRAKAAWQTAVKLDPQNPELQKILETYK